MDNRRIKGKHAYDNNHLIQNKMKSIMNENNKNNDNVPNNNPLSFSENNDDNNYENIIHKEGTPKLKDQMNLYSLQNKNLNNELDEEILEMEREDIHAMFMNYYNNVVNASSKGAHSQALKSLDNINRSPEGEGTGSSQDNNQEIVIKPIKPNTNFEWLNFIFTNPDWKSVYVQQEHIYHILINQALYYLSVFYNVYSERVKDKKYIKKQEVPTWPNIVSEYQKSSIQSHSTVSNNNNNNMNSNVMNTCSDANKPQIKIGIIGGGNIGCKLLREWIRIKDGARFPFKIYLSTRRPENIDIDIISVIDENVKIILNNEMIAMECDIIFLCIQPHQLDWWSKEIFSVLDERVEKLHKKRYKIFPHIVSFLSATPIDRLKLFFPKNIHITRTFLQVNIWKMKRGDVWSDDWKNKNKGREYLKESFEHFISRHNIMTFVSAYIEGLSKQFFIESILLKTNVKKQQTTNQFCQLPIVNDKRKDIEIESWNEIIARYLFGDDNSEKMIELYNTKQWKFNIATDGNSEQDIDDTELKKEIESLLKQSWYKSYCTNWEPFLKE